MLFRILSVRICSGLFLFAGTALSGFAQINADTLKGYYSLVQTGNYTEAEKLMLRYESAHPGNPDVWILIAEVNAYQYRIDTADSLYRKVLEADSGNHDRRCAYASFLMEQFRFTESESQLNRILSVNPTHERALFLKVRLEYWKGNYRKSRMLADRVNKKSPYQPFATELKQHAVVASAPLVRYEFTGYSDNQVLQGQIHLIRVEKRVSSLFNPGLSIQPAWYKTASEDVSKWLIGISDKCMLPEQGMSIVADAGMMMNKDSKGNQATVFAGGVEVQKQLGPSVAVELKLQRSPYNYNVNSILTPLMVSGAGLSVDLNRKLLLASGGYTLDRFDEGTVIQTLYAWGLFGLMRQRTVDVSAGYGFNYSNSSDSRFEPSYSVSEWLSSVAPSGVEGRYNPCFTPLQQQIHSILLQTSYRPSKRSTLEGLFSYGIYARAVIPYLYPEYDLNHNLVFTYGESPMTFHPVELKLYYRQKSGGHLEWKAGYAYVKNNFYTCHTLTAGIQYLIYHEPEIH